MASRPTPKSSPSRAKPRQQPSAKAAASASDAGHGDSQLVAALARGLALLDCFTRQDNGLGNAELAERSGLHSSTVSRLSYTLAVHGYLHFDPRTRLYQLGPRAMRLGAIAQASNMIRTLALPHMQNLATGSQFNVGLGTRDGHHMLYSDTCEGDAVVGLRLYAGSRLPMLSSAMGRAYLAACPTSEKQAILAALRPRYGDDWPHLIDQLDRAISEFETLGYCSSFGDWQRDIHGIAAPIPNVAGGSLYILNLGGPAYALGEREVRERHAPDLLHIIGTIANILSPAGLNPPFPALTS